MDVFIIRAPRIPREFFRANMWQSLLAICYASSLYLGGMVLGIWSLEQGSLELLLAAPALLLSAYGLFLLAVLGHEGMHFNLSRQRLLSCRIGVLSSAVLAGFCVVGYAVDHWGHHRQRDSSRDPERQMFARFRSLPTRLLLCRVAASLRFLVLTVRLALGDAHIAAAVPVKAAQLVGLARLNIAAQMAWLGLHLLLAFWVPGVMLAWLLVIGLVVVISGINGYQEHAFPEELSHAAARTRSSPICTALHLGANFHLEHHLYPGIPCWRLPKVHRLLQQSGWYADKSGWIEPHFFPSFRYAQRRYA